MARKTLVGRVDTNKMNKTVVVKVEVTKVHPKYHKRFTVYRKYVAHAEDKFNVGDLVEIEESKPLSKTKHWKVMRKIT
ncbi:MAG: 30S ribosomal protein S17 [Candidatus Doudnabacteria bacterium]|nr:30S ribosomal protein S17 [Candidatus Doudnabacteria bacterium]